MATYDYRRGNQAGNMYVRDGRVVVLERYLDFALIAAARVAAGVAALGAADILQIIQIPAGFYVDVVVANVIKAEGATFTFDIGDSASGTQWQSNTDGNVVAQTVTNAIANAKFYPTANYVAMNIDHASVDVAQVLVLVRMTDFRQQDQFGT